MNATQKEILEKNPNAKVLTLVYTGVRRGDKVKRVFGYRVVLEDGSLAEDTRYFKKSLYPGTCGTMIHLIADGDSYWIKAADYAGRWEDKAQCVAWQVEHDEVMADLDDKKDAMRDSVIEALKPVARAYRNANRAGRAVLLAKVIRYLTASAWD